MSDKLMSMQHKKSYQRISGATRRVGVTAVLFALALLLINSSAHQFKHAFGDISNVCAVCLQLDRDDQAVGSAISVVSPTSPFAAALPVPPASVSAPFSPAYQPRAPPSV